LKPEQSVIKIVQHLDKIIFNSKKFDIKDTILITGSPRSGTTILMDVLGVIPGYTSLFEPLNSIYFPESTKVGFKSRTYLTPKKNWPEGKKYLSKIFTGDLIYDSSWLQKGDYSKQNFNSILSSYFDQLKPEKVMHQLLGKKLIVKFVRLNRLLPWVAEEFQLRSMFLIIRHPCAVVASRLKPGQKLPNELQKNVKPFPTPKEIFNEASQIDVFDQGLLKKLKEIKTLEEIIATSWCLDNYVPLSTPKPYPWRVVIYERLIKEGEKEITRLFNEIGEKNIPRSAYKHLKIPSNVTQKNDKKIVSNLDLQLSKWKESLTEKQIERILSIVSAFGLDFYTEEIEPDYDKIGI
jgi:hypothetical protein